MRFTSCYKSGLILPSLIIVIILSSSVSIIIIIIAIIVFIIFLSFYFVIIIIPLYVFIEVFKFAWWQGYLKMNQRSCLHAFKPMSK